MQLPTPDEFAEFSARRLTTALFSSLEYDHASSKTRITRRNRKFKTSHYPILVSGRASGVATLAVFSGGEMAHARAWTRRTGLECLAVLLWSSAVLAGITHSAKASGSASARATSAAASAQARVQGRLLHKVTVQAPAPQYVAPSFRDRIGRIWAPVYLNGKGPFRLVLDTGATQSAVTARVAKALGIPLDKARPDILHGVVGTAIVPTIRVKTLRFGDLQRDNVRLPVVPDALGGADGVLGTEGFLGKRIVIDFRRDFISIRRSFERRAPLGYVTIRFKIKEGHLLTTDAYVGRTAVTAIIDTGSQTSVANLALRRALLRQRAHYRFSNDQILDATHSLAKGKGTALPPIFLGPVEILDSHITTGDMHIFSIWQLNKKPAILIGMDALGTVKVLIIDYRMRELQILTRNLGSDPSVYTQ